MDGVSVASGVAGLITLALQVSGTIAQYATAIKDRSKNVKELQDELSLLAEVLSHLKDFLLGEQGRGHVFDQGSILHKAVGDCTKRIERIQDKLKPPTGGRLSRAWEKVIWPFEQKDVLQMVENLRRFTHTFQFAVSIKGCSMLSKTSDDATKSLKDMLDEVKKISEASKHIPGLEAMAKESIKTSGHLQSIIELLPLLAQQAEGFRELSQANKLREEREYEQWKTDVLDWLAPSSTFHKHPDVQSRRTPGTGMWFTQHPDFIRWTDNSTSEQDLLCLGGPGRGKTVLCSLVIDHLREKYANQDVAVVHYYCDLSERQTQTPSHLALSVLRQLCQGFKTMPSVVSEFYAKTRNSMKDLFWFQELQSVLQRVVTTFGQCFLVIDAFDETDPKDQRRGLLDILDVIRASQPQTRVFATTRPHQGVELRFQNALSIEVSADEYDLRHFIHRKIDEHPNSKDNIDDELKAEIISRLCYHADGMFLLPALQIEGILDQMTKAKVRRALTSLSTTLEDVFGKTLDRIRFSKVGEQELAYATLMWISHARRPLTIAELQHAIAIRFEDEDLDLEDIPSVQRILDSCCGLVERDGESSYLRFVHTTLYEHLRKDDHGLFMNGEVAVTKKCLKYLSYKSAQLHPSKSRSDFLQALSTLPFLEYASVYWGFHAKSVPVTAYQDLALPILTNNASLIVAARVRDLRSPEQRKWKERMWAWAISGGGGISLAASFGLADLTEILIKQSSYPVLTARNMYGSTALHECAVHGFEETAKVLVEHNAPLLDSNIGRATPFYLAVSYEQIGVARLLLKYNRAQLDAPCRNAYTALHKACDSGSETMVTFLLQENALVAAQDSEGMTPMHLASRRGYGKIVQMLVLAGAPIDMRSKDGFTPLDWAATGGYLDIVQYLLEQKAVIGNSNRFRWTALHRSAKAGHADVSKVLLAAGVDIMAADRAGRLALLHAAQSGSLETLKVLLEYDSSLISQQLRYKDRKGSTAKDIAFYTANYHLHKYLRDLENRLLGNDPVFHPGPDPTLPLTHAIEQGSLSIVQAILTAQPELLTQPDPSGQTPLHTAFLESQREIAECILDQGVSINIRGYHQWTPLHIAISLSSLPMVSLALQHSADVFVVTGSKQSALHKAASANSIPVIIELLTCGCQLSARNDKGMTPIHVAAHRNFIAGMQEFLDPRWGGTHLVLSQDNGGRTPRSWAEFSGHLEMAAFLRNEERKVKGRPAHRSLRSLSRTDTSSTTTTTESGTLTRQTTMTESSSLSRRSTLSSSILLSPPSSRMGNRRSMESSFTEDYDNRGDSPSPMRSDPNNTTPTTTPKPSGRLMTPNEDPSLAEMERRFAEMEDEFASD